MGRDKGLLELNGKPFITHIIEALQPMVANIIIVSDNSAYDVFKLKRVEDLFADSGPLAGLYTALFYSETENNMVLSCDVPLINSTVLNMLMEGITSEIDVVQMESEGKTMPLVAIYKKRCINHFFRLLENGERRLKTAVEQLDVKTIQLTPELEKYVRNINTIHELNEIRNETND